MKALFGRILLSCVKAVPLARIQNKKGEWSDYTIGHAVHEAAAMHLATQAKLAELDRGITNTHKVTMDVASRTTNLETITCIGTNSLHRRVSTLEIKPPEAKAAAPKKASARSVKSAKRGRK